MLPDETKHGLFVGLTTLDLIYLTEQPPVANQKLVASDYTLSAGGPATNAAIAFAHLGNPTTLLSAFGTHPMTHLLLADLEQYGVRSIDLAPTRREPPAVSSIMVTQATGERAVISMNAVNTQVSADAIPFDCLQAVDVVLIDGHQMQVGQTIAQQAKSLGIPVVIDAGSWKPGFVDVLSRADYVICSANFHPPNCQHEADTLDYLLQLGIPHLAITHGEQPVYYWNQGKTGLVEVPQIRAIDTLGAGDIFHGAFCHAILREDFVAALAMAAGVASRSCQFFGTRRWMTEGKSVQANVGN